MTTGRDLATQGTVMAGRALQLGIMLLLVGVIGCGQETQGGQSSNDPLDQLAPTGTRPRVLRIGMTPSSGKNTAEVLAPLVDYLTQQLKMEVQSVTASSYDDVENLLRHREIEVGIFAPLSYVKAINRKTEDHQALPINGLPIATVTRRGSPTYLGYLIVRQDDPTQELSELRGKTVVWVSKSSTSGYLYPRALLRHKQVVNEGECPDHFLGKAIFAGDHIAAIEALHARQADVATVGGPFVEDSGLNPLTEQLGDKGGRAALRVLAKTDRIPLDCLVVRDDLARGLAKVLREALMTLHNDAKVSVALRDSWGMNGFVAPKHQAYETIHALQEAEEASCN